MSSILAQGGSNRKVVDANKIAELVRPRLDTEEAPFEGRVPDFEVEKEILNMISSDKDNGNKCFYIFDGQYHEKVEDYADFLLTNLGAPSYMITAYADKAVIEARFKEKNEIADELPEEEKNNIAEKANQAHEDNHKYKACFHSVISRVKLISLDTGVSKEALIAEIRSQFSCKVILVNHEKRIDVDTACSNLAIKYNMLYMSVYQLI